VTLHKPLSKWEGFLIDAFLAICIGAVLCAVIVAGCGQ
jgi:hypothetical protein